MITILAFLFVLGVLIFVHELGHFLVARFYGVRVVTFSLGFGPKLVKIRRGDTEYCISAVPLGGYVKLAGETVEDERTGSPDEFLSKNKWIRFQVYLAGPIMNLLLAWLLLAGVLWHGVEYETAPPIVASITAGGAAEAAGLEIGDRIESADGKDTPAWELFQFATAQKIDRPVSLVVKRRGETRKLQITPRAPAKIGDLPEIGAAPAQGPEIMSVVSGSPASQAGIHPGDVIIGVNGTAGLLNGAVRDQIRKSAGQPIAFTVLRDGQPTEITATLGKDGLLGVQLQGFDRGRIKATFWQSFSFSARENWDKTVEIGRTLKGLVTRETPIKQLAGPVGIGQLAGMAAQQGWLSLLQLMSMISLNLGLLNLLPVPILDGGQIAILAVEGLFRRDLSMKVKERILIAGAALIVMLMVTVIYNDIARLFR